MANQRVSALDRETKKVNTLFKSTARKTLLVNRTYKISDDIAKALDLYAAYRGCDKSEIVREALLTAMPEKYLEEARSWLSQQTESEQ